MDKTSHLTSSLKNSNLRLTPQRIAICDLLANTDTHPTAQQIYESLRPLYPTMSLATVYNTLDALVSVGAVNEIGTAGDGAVHYDADTGPHVNLACLRCHRVIDLPSRNVHALDDEVASESGYQILGSRVMYYGLCPQCSTDLGTERQKATGDQRKEIDD